jgi:hypothetical protein
MSIEENVSIQFRISVNLKEQNMLFNLVKILKILTMRKGSHDTIISGQILVMLNLTI